MTFKVADAISYWMMNAEEVPWWSLDLQSMGLGATWSSLLLNSKKDLVISGKWNPTFHAKSVCFPISYDFIWMYDAYIFSFMFLPFLLSWNWMFYCGRQSSVRFCHGHSTYEDPCKLPRLHPDWHTIDTTQPFKFALQVEEAGGCGCTGGQKWDAFSLQSSRVLRGVFLVARMQRKQKRSTHHFKESLHRFCEVKNQDRSFSKVMFSTPHIEESILIACQFVKFAGYCWWQRPRQSPHGLHSSLAKRHLAWQIRRGGAMEYGASEKPVLLRAGVWWRASVVSAAELIHSGESWQIFGWKGVQACHFATSPDIVLKGLPNHWF